MPLRGKSNNAAQGGIPVATSDPSTPVSNQLWVVQSDLKTQPVGLLLSITYSELVQHQLCKYASGSISRTTKI